MEIRTLRAKGIYVTLVRSAWGADKWKGAVQFSSTRIDRRSEHIFSPARLADWFRAIDLPENIALYDVTIDPDVLKFRVLYLMGCLNETTSLGQAEDKDGPADPPAGHGDPAQI